MKTFIRKHLLEKLQDLHDLLDYAEDHLIDETHTNALDEAISLLQKPQLHHTYENDEVIGDKYYKKICSVTEIEGIANFSDKINQNPVLTIKIIKKCTHVDNPERTCAYKIMLQSDFLKLMNKEGWRSVQM